MNFLNPKSLGIRGLQSEEDSSIFCKVETIKQVQAVLCVLPNALLVTLQKMPKIQGLQEGAAVDGYQPPPPYRLKMLLCSIALVPFKAIFGIEGIHEEHE